MCLRVCDMCVRIYQLRIGIVCCYIAYLPIENAGYVGHTSRRTIECWAFAGVAHPCQARSRVNAASYYKVAFRRRRADPEYHADARGRLSLAKNQPSQTKLSKGKQS